MTKHWVECDTPIDPSSLSFEQKLINDEDIYRKCFDSIMLDGDKEFPPLHRKGFLSLT